MTGTRFLSKNDDRSTHKLGLGQPAEVIQKIKFELEKSGSESYFIGKRAEDLLARVYFPDDIPALN